MLAGEIAQGVVLVDQVGALRMLAKLIQGVEGGHDARGIGRHSAIAPVQRPYDAQRVVAGRRL